jgi:hypothetical protein
VRAACCRRVQRRTHVCAAGAAAGRVTPPTRAQPSCSCARVRVACADPGHPRGVPSPRHYSHPQACAAHRAPHPHRQVSCALHGGGRTRTTDACVHTRAPTACAPRAGGCPVDAATAAAAPDSAAGTSRLRVPNNVGVRVASQTRECWLPCACVMMCGRQHCQTMDERGVCNQ